MDREKNKKIKTHIRELEVGEWLRLMRDDCIPSSVYSMAYGVAADLKRKYRCQKTDTTVTVTRVK